MLLSSVAGAPALGEPTKPPNESGSASLNTLRKNLESAATGYVEAQNQLEVSKKHQEQLATSLAGIEMDVARLRQNVALYAAQAYKTGRIGTFATMINSGSPDSFLSKATTLERMTNRDQRRLASFAEAKLKAREAKAAIDAEVAKQATFAAMMEKRKAAAAKALTVAGSRRTTGYIDPNSPLAAPAPRNSDGSWPRESCSINDPTTSGCITPRTLHALQQAKTAGFKRYVSCYRPGDMYEHPKGRACDFASATGGFGGSASGGDRLYGDKLASFFIKNASRLGVLYVIWYCNIWINGAWKSYSSTGSKCGDNPSGDHTNHVHLSVY